MSVLPVGKNTVPMSPMARMTWLQAVLPRMPSRMRFSVDMFRISSPSGSRSLITNS